MLFPSLMITPESVTVTLEFTPNPNTLKFVASHIFLSRGAANFTSAEETDPSPLAKRLFAVPGVQAVLVGTNFVTVTKTPDGDWDILAEEVPKALKQFAASGEPAVAPAWLAEREKSSGTDSDIERRIREVLDNEIRPAVAMDGGDITFGRFDDGIVYLHLEGACSSCPSSIATLKMGVESRLKEVVPEVKEVVQV